MRVLCTLANAAESISGIAFTRTDGGMLSEPVAPDVANRFAAIPGYIQVYEVESDIDQSGGRPLEVSEAAAEVSEAAQQEAAAAEEPAEAVRRGPGRSRKAT